MKPSLQNQRRILRRLLKQTLNKNLIGPVEVPRRTPALRYFASARPLPEEQHKVHLKHANVKQRAENSRVVQEEEYDYQSPHEIHYPGTATMPVTSVLHIVKPGEDVPRGIWPVFRLMDESGKFRDPAFDSARQNLSEPIEDISMPVKPSQSSDDDGMAKLRSKLQEQYPFHAKELEASGLLKPSKHPYPDTNSRDTLLRAHRQIARLREMDTIFQNAQRQGRISFYMTCRGEEAIHFGSASALDPADTVFAQYREAGLLMWRGFTLEQFANQCFSNDADLGKGRQMPVHYGSRALNYQTISSPLGTQIPQAVGAAYHKKLQRKPNVAVCFFGDGAASTTDFHSGLNFAATLKAPVIFFCRNNGYAISTPVRDQYAGDGIISRAPGYGMAAIRVDGNDLFAVHAAVREAREYALANSSPVLIEAMTYRLGHHSTSDDSSRYRDKEEVDSFEDRSDPMGRFERFLKHCGLITESELVSVHKEEKRAVLKAMADAEKRPPPPLEDLFTDVYLHCPPRLEGQQAQLLEHLKKHKSKY